MMPPSEYDEFAGGSAPIVAAASSLSAPQVHTDKIEAAAEESEIGMNFVPRRHKKKVGASVGSRDIPVIPVRYRERLPCNQIFSIPDEPVSPPRPVKHWHLCHRNKDSIGLKNY